MLSTFKQRSSEQTEYKCTCAAAAHLKRSARQQERRWRRVKRERGSLQSSDTQRWSSLRRWRTPRRKASVIERSSSSVATGTTSSLLPTPFSSASHVLHRNTYLSENTQSPGDLLLVRCYA